MEKEDFKKWFLNIFNSCYLVEDEEAKGNFYMYYDENYLRLKKISRILNEKIIIRKQKPSDKELFYQN